jgi:hypothetical protein
VADLDPPFLSELGEQERIHFRNLLLIRPQIPSERQLLLIEGLARTLSSQRLLTLIARTPHWLIHGPITQALADNENTPEPIRRDLELAVSLFDLLHGMDKAPASEKEERAETVKAVYQQLPLNLKAIVKHQLKQLAKQVNPTGLTQELPPLPTDQQGWGSSHPASHRRDRSSPTLQARTARKGQQHPRPGRAAVLPPGP